MTVRAIGGAEAAGPPLPNPQQHVRGRVIAGFREEELYDTVLIAREEFDNMRWEGAVISGSIRSRITSVITDRTDISDQGHGHLTATMVAPELSSG